MSNKRTAKSDLAGAKQRLDDLKSMRTLLPLLRLLTVRQVIDAGDEAINACGLNPWCLNEGRAEPEDRAFDHWRSDRIKEMLDDFIYAEQLSFDMMSRLWQDEDDDLDDD